jgi:exodeoxyribonuclease V alpha subunit
MHGGMKVYAGSPAAARCYVEAGRGRADDYYLAEGTGLARRYSAGAGRPVTEQAPLTGDAYEAWVAGQDPDTGRPRGRLRTDGRAVRFVEVVVNGPKSWSLAAALHPDIAAAYDAAQDRAALQIIDWLAQHVATRVGPRGGQVQLPVELLEAVTVAHHTSRAGDPHRHLHLQVNARVFAAGGWRGLHTVGVRDFLGAINGIGHAAIACDPHFRAALAAHGYALDSAGEIRQLADFVGAFSARAAQIARNIEKYELEWTRAHPGEHAGPALRRAWDARAWAEGRPDKVTPTPGAELTIRWLAELAALGYRDPERPAELIPTPIGELDRDQAAGRVLARLAAGRSAWNAADVRGDAEQLIAADGIVAAPAVRAELAEDLTVRALSRCVSLVDRDGVPEHIRAWTSQPVLDVETDLAARLAARNLNPHATPRPLRPLPAGRSEAVRGLDVGQAAAVAALAGDRPLVVVEGAAGAGKTTTLAATRGLLEQQGRRLTVVTPTLKAAQVAAGELGAPAGSAAWLVYQHGWRWADQRTWTRLTTGEVDPVTGRVHTEPQEGARLRAGDLLVVDEAGMLDQDTARALLTVADESGVRVALLGDRHQLPAVGRGGVLDLAAAHTDPTTLLTLDAVHRFTRADGTGGTVPDTGYAELTLAMRTGEDPGAVFDVLAARGHIRLHADAAAREEALAEAAAAARAAGTPVVVVVDTREQATALNAAIRDRLVADGLIDDIRATSTRAGQRVGSGDRIATRRNDRQLGVANRDTWTVTAVGPDGDLVVTPTSDAPGSAGSGGVTPGGGEQRMLPRDYVTSYVELAYAATAHGVQGDTVPTAHVVIGEHTGAASAYVGMTRGRTANTAHLVAADLADARDQWIAVLGRDRADLGPGHAAELAAAEAARYAETRPLDQVLADLHQAWEVEQRCTDRLAFWGPQLDILRRVVAVEADHAGDLARLVTEERRTALAAKRAQDRAEASARMVAAGADRLRDSVLACWDTERDAARAAARVALDGPGRLRLRRAAVTCAGEHLVTWAGRWRPYLPDLPTGPTQIARAADRFDDRPTLVAAFAAAARRTAERDHPDHTHLRAAADTARHAHHRAKRALADASRRHDERLAVYGPIAWAPDPQRRLADLERDVAATGQELGAVQARIARLTTEPALLGQPAARLAEERDAWRARRDADRTARQTAASPASPPRPTHSVRPPEPVAHLTPRPGVGPGFGR